MTLIDEAAADSDLRQITVGILQKLLGPFDAALDQPLMRGHAGRLLEGAREISL